MPPPLDVTGRPDARVATRTRRGRFLGACMAVLVVAAAVHIAVAIVQAALDKLTPLNVAAPVAMNVVILGAMLWLAREARLGRRLFAASGTVVAFTFLMLAAFAAAHFGWRYEGTALLTAVQIGVAGIAVFTSAVAIAVLAV
jgi:hypothetical protein